MVKSVNLMNNYVSSKTPTNYGRRIILCILFTLSVLLIFCYKKTGISNFVPNLNVVKDCSSKISDVEDLWILEKSNYTEKDLQQINEAKECYKVQNQPNNVQLLEDIDESPPKPDKTIFFTISSCINTTRITLTARQACAIESAAKLNPKRDIFVLFIGQVGSISNEPDLPIVTALKSYSNVYLRNVDIYNFSKGTPAEQWIKQDHILSSPFYRWHLSDYLRLIALYKYGGMYFDTDFIFLKTFDGSFPPNFGALQSPKMESLANAILGFESTDVGHKMVGMILRESFEHYQPHSWAHNAGAAMLRVLKRISKRTELDEVRPEFYWGFKIFSPSVFFPLNWWTPAYDTKPQTIKNVMKNIKNETVAMHLWSSQTSKEIISKSDKPRAYTILAQKHCPKVYGSSGPYFNKK